MHPTVLTKIIKSVAVSLLFSFGSLFADSQARPAESILEITEDGFSVVPVLLHSLSAPEHTRVCRFLLSTTYERSLLDSSIPPEFFWEDSGSMLDWDMSGSTHAYPSILIKRLNVAGIVRDAIPGARTDLMNTLNRHLDRPVDGILGMSFLRGTRFIFDAGQFRIRWWAWPFRGAALPVTYARGGIPTVNLKVGQTEIRAEVGLALMGGLSFPARLKPNGPGEVSASTTMMGPAIQGSIHVLDRVEAGPGAWIKVQGDFDDCTRSGSIGLDVLAAAPVCFDFVEHRLILQMDSQGRLPMRSRISTGLPVVWDRTGPVPKLVVAWVKPGSPMEKAGCRTGDELVSAGNLSGRGLDRRSLKALMDQGRPHEWVVKREGRRERLRMFEPSQP